MTAFWLSYIILPITCLLLFLLGIILIKLLYKWRKVKLATCKTAPVLRLPSFQIPVGYRTVDAQTPVNRKDVEEIQRVSNRRKIGISYMAIPKFADSESLSPSKEENDSDAFGAFGSGTRQKMTDTYHGETNCIKDYTVENKQLSCTGIAEKDTVSTSGSVTSFSSTELERDQQIGSSTKGRQRRISVTVFQHLRSEGKKISQSEPALLESENNTALANALEAAEFPSYSSTIDPAIELADVSAEEMKSKSEHKKTDMRKHLADRMWNSKSNSARTGKICFTTFYEPDQKLLEVTVLRAFDLGKRKDHNNVNPFVRLYLLPGKKQKQHTRVRKKTKEPFFDDKRVFYNLSERDLQAHCLKLKVYSRGAVKKNELLGESDVALGSLKIKEKETFILDLHIAIDQESAQIMISLLHDAARSKLQIVIHKAKDIPKSSSVGLPDTYCRILLFREQECEKKETKIKRNTRSPCWDETHVLSVATDISSPLNMMSLVVTVISHSLMGKDEIVGHVIFSLDSTQSEAANHWKSVEDSPYSLITKWHTLIQPEELEHVAVLFR